MILLKNCGTRYDPSQELWNKVLALSETVKAGINILRKCGA